MSLRYFFKGVNFLGKNFLTGAGVAGVGTAAVAVAVAVPVALNASAAGYVINDFYVTPTANNADALKSTYIALADRGAKVIVGSGFDHAAPTALAFQQNPEIFADKGFLIIDSTPPMVGDGYDVSKYAGNVAALQFRSDMSGFVTGISMALMLNEYSETFNTSASEGLTFGTYGGLPFASVTSFMAGMQKGVDFANTQLGTSGKYAAANNKAWTEVTQKFVNNDAPTSTTDKEGVMTWSLLNTEFAGGFGVSDGNAIIDNFIAQKVDCIFPVAGPQTEAAIPKLLDAVYPVFLAGVDAPQDLNVSINKASAKLEGVGNGQVIQMSALKNIEVAAEQIFHNINNGISEPVNGYAGFNYTSIGDLANGGVGVSAGGEQYLIEAMDILAEEKGTITTIEQAYTAVSENTEAKTLLETMKFVGPEGVGEVGYGGGLFGLMTSPAQIANPSEVELVTKPEDFKGFVKEQDQKDATKIQLSLSTSTSVINDYSFSEQAYAAMFNFMTANKISLPWLR